MADQLKILIVEDTASDIQFYKDIIQTFNQDSTEYKLDATYKTNKIDGLDALSFMKDELCAAFIDLKLTSGEQVDLNEGNDIIREIYGKLRFPIYVLTNTPGAFNSEFTNSVFLELHNKTSIDYVTLFNKIVSIHKTGILKILGGKGQIEQMLNDIFWKNISGSLHEWFNIDHPEKHLLRYTLTHLQEHLELNEDKSTFINVYPIENYIKPSIKSYFMTGDIIVKKDDKSKRFLILTPACDLAPHGDSMKPKASHVILSEIEHFTDTPMKNLIKKAKSTEPGNEKVELSKQSLIKYITNNSSQKYYYLPDTSIIKGGLINFQKLSTLKITGLDIYEKEATIASQFIKDIIAKFSFYYSRQGSPDFNYDELLNKHLN